MKKLLRGMVLFLGALAACGDGKNDTILKETNNIAQHFYPIYDGNLAPAGAFQSVVYVRTSTSGCTGTLINSKTVLTAAHCLDDHPAASSVAVGFGNNYYSGLDWYWADRYSVHPEFKFVYFPLTRIITSSHHDLALIFLKYDAPYEIAKLVSPEEEAAYVKTGGIEKFASVVGFGNNNYGRGVPTSGVKMMGTGLVEDIGNWVIELSNFGGSGCQGDSGGPFYSVVRGTNKQAGVLSFGGNCSTGRNNYAKTSRDLWWIHVQAALPYDSGLACNKRCGDGVCDWPCGEAPGTCYSDCRSLLVCGDRICSPDAIVSESYKTCPGDCKCGDFVCDAEEQADGTCYTDCRTPDIFCPDGICAGDETPYNCPQDCKF